MKKKLLLGVMAVTLMAASTTKASDLALQGETGLARTPLAMALAPMSMAVAADYLASDKIAVPMRAQFGLPYGIEVGGAYNWVDLKNTWNWDVDAKWVLPQFVENLALAVGGHYKRQNFMGGGTNNGDDLFAVATYDAKLGEGMSLIPSAGVIMDQRTGDNSKTAWRGFGSLLFKMQMFAVGGEYMTVNHDYDGKGVDAYYWFGGRFYLNPMFTLQAGFLNNANYNDGTAKTGDGKFHVGGQFAFNFNK
jgi:hypothetical protein